MDPNPDNTMLAQVQSIFYIANDLKKATASYSSWDQISATKDTRHSIDDSIRLPSPPPLLPSLLEADVTLEIANTADRIYQQHAEELKQHIERTVTATCLKLVPLPGTLVPSPDLLTSKVTSTFTEMYLRRLWMWRKEIVERVAQAPKVPARAPLKNSRSFNHEYTPFLERFFEENAFPTHADKVFLAKKSNMEYRQIHVWFQNRRNRNKKEGKTSRRMLTCEGIKKPVDELYERAIGRLIGSNYRAPKAPKVGSSEGKPKIEISLNDGSKDTFASSSPPHAFPSSYPPTCHYEPFPCKSGPTGLSKSEWWRRPCRKPPLPLSTNIDELVERFSQLNVRDETRCRGSPEWQSHAAIAAITVIPSRAPHPSLIVYEYPQSTNTIRRHPIVRAPTPSSNRFLSPSPALQPVTLVPPSAPLDKSEFLRKRNTVPLPRRFPGRAGNTCRHATPSESSTPSSSTRSFSPDSESRNCSFSSISPLPSPPDIASAKELPHLFGSPCRSPTGSPIHLHGLGGMVATILSSVS